jgi:hypothetical protein
MTFQRKICISGLSPFTGTKSQLTTNRFIQSVVIGSKFVVGTVTKTTDEGQPSRWGRAIVAVSDNESGRQFVELFAKSFSGTMPAESSNPQPPRPLFVNTAILAEDFRRDPGGGFTEGNGGWTATKWFPTNDFAEAEVYFNFNIDQRMGEFSEKDAEYADDLLSILAAALRDGPRPPRTPENDQNLTLEGPSIGPARQLLKRRTSLNTFTSNSRYAVYQDGGRILALAVEDLGGQPVEIAQFDYSPWDVHLVNEDIDLLVQEGIPEEPGVKSSADPMRIWWVNQATKEKKLLRVPEKDLSLSEKPISPDYRFVALAQWMTHAKRKTRNKVIHILDRTNGTAITVQLPKIDLSLVGWTESAAGLRAIGMTNRWGFDKDKPPESYLIDPSSGKIERIDAQPEPENVLQSPDGKHQVAIGDGRLFVTDLNTGEKRIFSFHDEDQPFVGEACVEWVSPDFLKFNAPKLALIDVQTMKMSFPPSADGNRFPTGAYTFSPDFRWVLYQDEGTDGEGVFLAPVQLPICDQ